MATISKISQPALKEQKCHGGLQYIRHLGRRNRTDLTRGNKVQLVNHEGCIIMSREHPVEMPLRLFKAASTKHYLVDDGKITVPKGISENAVKYLISWILALPAAAKVCQIQCVVIKDTNGQPVDDFVKDLHLCCAADALGMRSFTRALFNTFFIRVNTAVPGVAGINTITALTNPTGYKLFEHMADTIAKKLYEGTFANSEDFKAFYLPSNPRLSKLVYQNIARLETIQKHSEARDKVQLEQRQASRERQAAKATVAVKKNVELKEAGESYRQKAREGRKDFTQLEARYAWQMTGKRVAIKPSS
ncbi:hypothetical protein GMOD_00008850 [Pyrenophora seminiperda CCB06]|uniref:Uncharacterized protein n=1 Tax=Pyrenophora seminiperda CCB06 TaxID=1302712 RepID=A0A3M7M618_9PLEO|nr:hypothetical protein GMOD_00008850 [Pyrenophora seminiperda CCB06]